MPIPAIPEFETMLSAIRLSPNKTSSEVIDTVQIPFLRTQDENDHISPKLPLWLHYPKNTPISMDRLLDRISKELIAANHAKDKEFALLILAFSALIGRRSTSSVELVNALLTTICSGDVSLYFILWAVLPDFYQYKMPPFRLGPLRTLKLQHDCKKAESNFYERYQSRLQQAWAIEREHRKVRVLDFGIFGQLLSQQAVVPTVRQPWEVDAIAALMNGYFSQQNRVLFDEFWSELVTAQDPLLVLGAPYFDPKPLITSIEALHVAAFRNMGVEQSGFIACTTRGQPHPINFDLANAPKQVPQILAELSSTYGFEGFDDSPLHASIRLFASFIARARRHQIDGNANEALLHFVIGLELIFGGREAIQRSVSERVALLTHSQLGRSFDQQRRWIDSVYDLRSKYVHAGAAISNIAVLETLYEACQLCFCSLLKLQRAQTEQSTRDEETLKGWLVTLDYLAKAAIAQKAVDAQQLREAHIG